MKAGRLRSEELCRAVLTMPGCAGRDVVVVVAPRTLLLAQLEAEVHTSRLFHHLPPNMEAPHLLGPDDLEVIRGGAGWPVFAPQRAWRQWRMDTLYGTSHAIGLIVLAASALPETLLDGARYILEIHRPVVLLDLSGMARAELAALRARFARLAPGYRVVTWQGPLLLLLPPGAEDVPLPKRTALGQITLKPGDELRADNFARHRSAGGDLWCGAPTRSASVTIVAPGPGFWRVEVLVDPRSVPSLEHAWWALNGGAWHPSRLGETKQLLPDILHARTLGTTATVWLAMTATGSKAFCLAGLLLNKVF